MSAYTHRSSTLSIQNLPLMLLNLDLSTSTDLICPGFSFYASVQFVRVSKTWELSFNSYSVGGALKKQSMAGKSIPMQSTGVQLHQSSHQYVY